MMENDGAQAPPGTVDWLRPYVRRSALRVEPWVKKRRTGLNLSSNEFVHPEVDRAVADALRDIDPRRISGYADPQELADALAAYHGIEPERLIVTAGSDDAVRCLAAAVLRTCGRLVLQEPNYALVRKYAQLNEVSVHSVGPTAPSRAFALEDFVAALECAGGPAVAYLSNPNGPVGSCFTLEQMGRLARFCEDHGHLLVIDEAYVPYNGFDHLGLARQFRSVLLIRSFSKSMGTAGARVAMMVGDAELMSYLRRWYPSNPLSGTAIHLMRRLLERDELLVRARADIIETRQWFTEWIGATLPGWRPIPSSANFVNFDVGAGAVADEVVARLRERDIHVRSMSGVRGLDRCLRVTVADRPTMERVAGELIGAANGVLIPGGAGARA